MTDIQMDIYQDFITYYNYDKPEIAWGKCKDACEEMKTLFPELIICKGLIWGIDIYNIKESREHVWLKDENGKIYDPTFAQFNGWNSIEYEEDKGNASGKCRECGHLCYKNNDFCSDKCENSYMEYLTTGIL